MENEIFLENFLTEEFDLSQKEVSLYINLLKYGKLTIFELAKAAEMNRSTTHVNVDSLVQKGLATQLSKGRGSRRYIIAEPVEKLELLLKNKKAKLEAAENRLPDVMKGLLELKDANIAGGNMEIGHYKGLEEVRLIYDDILKANEIRTFGNTMEVAKFFPENFSRFIEAHNNNKNMIIWEILENSPATRHYILSMDQSRCFCRLASKKLTPSIDCLIYDGKIAMIDEKPGSVSGIIIENANFYNISKAIHQFVWNYLEELKT